MRRGEKTTEGKGAKNINAKGFWQKQGQGLTILIRN
jgi:hypothetical protein